MIDAVEEDDGQPMGLATTGLRSSRSALQQSLHATRTTPMQRHRATLLDTKEQEQHRSFSTSLHAVSAPHDYLTSEEYEQGLQALAEANALLRDEVETLKRQHVQDNAVQEQTTDRIQQESEQVERLNEALKQEEERSALLTNELTDLQASNTQCELHYGRERVAYETTIDTLTANVQQWQSTSSAKEEDTVQLKEKIKTMVAEMEELKTVATENKHLLLDKERKAKALEEALQEMKQEKENVRQQTIHLTQDLEHQKTRILDCERSREEGNHELRG
jgi:chromosome segregation ATPase